MSNTHLAWHFVGDTLRNGDPVPPDGEWLEHNGPIKICSSGLHASDRPLDALKFAPGPTLCRVECAGGFDAEGDKSVWQRRKILWRLDAAELLQAFARGEALSVAHLWQAPDIVLRYLRLGREVDRDAAWAAARDAARGARWSAARSAACDTACDATWNAACDAARAATWNATWSAARGATRDTAWGAAWDAGREAANKDLEEMIDEHRAGWREWEWEEVD